MNARILFVAREFTEGGAAYLAFRHMRRMAESRPIDLLVTGPVSEGLVAQLPAGVSFTKLQVNEEAVKQGLLATREAIVASGHPCLETEYDAVIGSSLFPDIVACATFALCRGTRKLVVLLDEGLLTPKRSDDVRAAMQGAILAADHLLPVSQGLLDTLATTWPALRAIPATVIPPPIELPRAHEPDPLAAYRGDGRLRIVTVARLSPEKQLLMCLRIHRTLRDAGHDFHWHVVGEGPERPKLTKEIAALGMADRFWLEGFQESPRAWMRHADLFVLCSRSEGCPTVIREALAEGTPVLSTDVNGARELIDEGVTGVVVPNDESAIAQILGNLMGDGAARGRFREAITGRKREARDGRETETLVARLAGGPRLRPTPEVTILIPTYNHAAFLARAIQSALMQDYPSVEVVACDDASTDDTEAAARPFRHDPRFRYVRREQNLGRVANYRRALENDATGTWVLMLDGDDHLTDPCFITTAMRALTACADSAPRFAQAGHRVVRQPGAFPPGKRRPAWKTLQVDILPDIPHDSQVMAGGDYLRFVYETGFFTHLGTLYRRDAAIRQGFYTRDISSADMDSLLRLALTGNVIVLKTIAGAWVQHGANASSNLPLESIEENVRIFRTIAREGAAAGHVDMQQIARSLTRYEARTLGHLFHVAVGNSASGFSEALRMTGIIMRINPRVLMEPALAKAWWRCCTSAARRSLKDLERRVKRMIGRSRDRSR
jgi:glycosyltransferase involved in cell wall biosynthesis/GT2 family glycosyltransferase